MNLRTDSFHIAGWRRSAALGARAVGERDVETDPKYADIPRADLGDVWVLHNRNGGVTGYALTCPNQACPQGVHPWDHAYNCPVRSEPDAPPCWTWTGSIEEGNLTASPSLHVMAELGGCGWHGWLRDGQMVLA